MRWTWTWLLLWTFGAAQGSAQPVVDFAFGLGGFLNRTQVAGRVTFTETPQVAFVSANPGGDGKSIYYDSFIYQDVEVRTVNWNSNKPGQRRLTDVGHSGTAEFYNVGSGNLLLPGLGQRLFNDDGVLIDFTRLSSPVNAFGVNFGSIQPTSPCCVVQLFSFELSNGQVRDVYFESGNNYGGRSTELSHSTFVGFHVEGAFIRRVQIEQLGHNPILDNLTWGVTKPGAAPGRPHIVLNFPNPPGPGVPPARRIELVDPENSSTRKLIDDMKPDWRSDAVTNRRVSDLAGLVSGLRGGIVGFYSEALEHFTALNARIFDKYADDPPRFDYDVVAEYEASETPVGFVDQFGAGYESLDETFLVWEYTLANLELGLTTLERLQGAILDGDTNAMERQGEALVFLMSEADYGLERVDESLGEILALLKDEGVGDFEVGDTTFYGLNAMTAEAVANSRTIVNLRSTGAIFHDGFESGDTSSWSVAP